MQNFHFQFQARTVTVHVSDCDSVSWAERDRVNFESLMMILLIVEYTIALCASAILACISYFSYRIFKSHMKYRGIPGPKRKR